MKSIIAKKSLRLYTGNLKKQKGITLVALVVTIIILLILAGITISQLTGSGLFENARLAEEKSKEAEEKEESILSDYENEVESYINGNRDKITIDKEEYNKVLERIENLENNHYTFLAKVSGNSSQTYPDSAKELYVYFWINGISYPMSPTIIPLTATRIFNHDNFNIAGQQDSNYFGYKIRINTTNKTFQVISGKCNNTEYISNTTYPVQYDLYYK